MATVNKGLERSLPRRMDLADFVKFGGEVAPWPAAWLPDFKNRAVQLRRRFGQKRTRGVVLAPPCLRVYWTTYTLYMFVWMKSHLHHSDIVVRDRWLEVLKGAIPRGTRVFHDPTNSPDLPWCVLLRVPAGSKPWKWWAPLFRIPPNLEIRIESLEGHTARVHVDLVTWTEPRGMIKYETRLNSAQRRWLVARVGDSGWLPRSVFHRLSSQAWEGLHGSSGS